MEVVRTSSGMLADAQKMIDEDPNTFWATDEGVKTPQEVVIDLGEIYDLKGFTYWPIQERYPFGIITKYRIFDQCRQPKLESRGQGRVFQYRQ